MSVKKLNCFRRAEGLGGGVGSELLAGWLMALNFAFRSVHCRCPTAFGRFGSRTLSGGKGTQSDATSVTLRGVTRDLTGQFQCEVSEDAPLFHTDIRQARMQVVELPKEDPQMQLDKTHITTLDSFRSVCTVGTSFPAANITWYINSKRIHRTPYQRITYRSYEGTPTFSSLEMFPHSQVLQDIYQSMPPFHTSLTVMCEISILHIYTKSVQQRILVSDLVTTISPNLLGLDGSNNRRKNNGDPDNSPLTGATPRPPAGPSTWLLFVLLLPSLWIAVTPHQLLVPTDRISGV
ncbi:AGAP001658-PA-like protein [Anopheles sinensis]|uniref:AGAP001658-PA-like protein n=1 Tax=Anopheles sinensis TaxID=74873 RepID=A0A084WBT0_ANOSI|nr:AGAP001658-PA-like protein [Anopheles sinensis]